MQKIKRSNVLNGQARRRSYQINMKNNIVSKAVVVIVCLIIILFLSAVILTAVMVTEESAKSSTNDEHTALQQNSSRTSNDASEPTKAMQSDTTFFDYTTAAFDETTGGWNYTNYYDPGQNTTDVIYTTDLTSVEDVSSDSAYGDYSNKATQETDINNGVEKVNDGTTSGKIDETSSAGAVVTLSEGANKHSINETTLPSVHTDSNYRFNNIVSDLLVTLSTTQRYPTGQTGSYHPYSTRKNLKFEEATNSQIIDEKSDIAVASSDRTNSHVLPKLTSPVASVHSTDPVTHMTGDMLALQTSSHNQLTNNPNAVSRNVNSKTILNSTAPFTEEIISQDLVDSVTTDRTFSFPVGIDEETKPRLETSDLQSQIVTPSKQISPSTTDSTRITRKAYSAYTTKVDSTRISTSGIARENETFTINIHSRESSQKTYLSPKTPAGIVEKIELHVPSYETVTYPNEMNEENGQTNLSISFANISELQTFKTDTTIPTILPDDSINLYSTILNMKQSSDRLIEPNNTSKSNLFLKTETTDSAPDVSVSHADTIAPTQTNFMSAATAASHKVVLYSSANKPRTSNHRIEITRKSTDQSDTNRSIMGFSPNSSFVIEDSTQVTRANLSLASQQSAITDTTHGSNTITEAMKQNDFNILSSLPLTVGSTNIASQISKTARVMNSVNIGTLYASPESISKETTFSNLSTQTYDVGSIKMSVQQSQRRARPQNPRFSSIRRAASSTRLTTITTTSTSPSRITTATKPAICGIRFEGKCYLLITGIMDLKNANERCKMKKGKLADILNRKHYNVMVAYIRKNIPSNKRQFDVWTAMTLMISSGKVRLSNFTTATFMNWYPGQPSRRDFNRRYIYIHVPRIKSLAQGMVNYPLNSKLSGALCIIEKRRTTRTLTRQG